MAEAIEAQEARPKAKKKEPPIIEIIWENCKGCNLCVEVCPQNVLAMRKEPSKWEGYIVEVVNVDKCTRCMLCEVQCPDFAIRIY